MGILELFFLAVGLSMDAFAVSVCAGLTIKNNVLLRKALIVGLYFGAFQAVMPLIGYAVATLFAGRIIAYDHWIAFVLLCFLGVKMILGSRKNDESNDSEFSVKPAHMLPFAFATSIDALTVGISFAFLRVNIVLAVTFIGLTTLILSILGVKIGSVFGAKMKSKAEIVGGVILILIGLKILLEHLDLIKF